jgi:2'-5' RNA ligase
MAAKKEGKARGDAAREARATAETVRAFVALDLDAMSLRRVVRIADRLRMGSGAPSANWTPAANMHATLKFMGELAADAVAPFGQALGEIVAASPAPGPYALRLSAFPRASHARIVVVELDEPGEARALAKLAEKIEKLAGKYGVPKEDRAFRPHVTLARLKLEYDARRWLRPDLAEGAEARAARVTLYRSELGKAPGETSTYVPLASFDFPAA